jgi:hypothetical protein
MLETFTAETFEARIGEEFRVIVDDRHYMPVRLAEVAPWGPNHGKGHPRPPFRLLFRAAPGLYVPQMTYVVLNENMQPFELFLVPIQPDGEEGVPYEAIFT